MKIRTTEDGRRFSDISSQKDIENYLLHHYCIPRKLFREAVFAGREVKYGFIDIESCGRVVVITLTPRRMWIASCPKEQYQPIPAYKC